MSVYEIVKAEGHFDVSKVLSVGKRVFCRVDFLCGSLNSGEFFAIVKEIRPAWLGTDIVVTREDTNQDQYVDADGVWQYHC